MSATLGEGIALLLGLSGTGPSGTGSRPQEHQRSALCRAIASIASIFSVSLSTSLSSAWPKGLASTPSQPWNPPHPHPPVLGLDPEP